MTIQRLLTMFLLGLLPFVTACQRNQADDPSPAPAARTLQQIQQQALDQAAKDVAANPGPADGGGVGGGAGGGSAQVNVEPIKVVMGGPDENGVAPANPPSVNWDFTTERSTKKIHWPDQGDNNYYSLEGDFNFSLKLRDGTHIAERVWQVNARREGTLVKGVEITSHPQSTDGALKQTRELMDSLGFEKSALGKLDDWHAKARQGNYNNLELKLENSDNRVYTLRIINDGTSELPWSVGLDIDWSKVCGCHG